MSEVLFPPPTRLIIEDKLMGMAQMGFPDFQKMLNSYSAIPIYLSLNANRNARGPLAED